MAPDIGADLITDSESAKNVVVSLQSQRRGSVLLLDGLEPSLVRLKTLAIVRQTQVAFAYTFA